MPVEPLAQPPAWPTAVSPTDPPSAAPAVPVEPPVALVPAAAVADRPDTDGAAEADAWAADAGAPEVQPAAAPASRPATPKAATTCLFVPICNIPFVTFQGVPYP